MRSRVFVIWAALTIWACGAAGLWASLTSSLKEPEDFYVVGAAASVAFAVACLALVRRAWARVPFIGVCVVAGVLVQDSLFSEKDPSVPYSLGFVVLNLTMILLAGVAVLVEAIFRGQSEPGPTVGS